MSPAATATEVTAAFRRFALRNHPDRGGDPDRFRAGAEAYRRLRSGGPTAAGPATSAPRADVVFHRRRRPARAGIAAVVRRARHTVARPRP